MSKSRKVVGNRTAKKSRSRRPPAKALAVQDQRLSATARVTPNAKDDSARQSETSPHIVDLMLAWSPVGMLLRQQAAFASMLQAPGLDESKHSPTNARQATNSRARRRH